MLIARSTEIHLLPFMSHCKLGQGDMSLMFKAINVQ